ncbi:MAG: peptidoglycan-binding protein [Christensenellaceae bacterium]|nr:peptidoglycan-binding protein [Christensenellaceae bacterium]MEA5069485.1 peptidoglycan-binding protein [Christensenellaceae bacterium]
MRTRWMRALTLILMGLMLSAPAHAKLMRITREVKLYKASSTRSKVLAALDADTTLDVLGVKKGWAKVKLNGRGGFIDRRALAPLKEKPKPDAPAKQTMYAKEAIKLRKAASAASKALAQIEKGEAVTLAGKKGRWAKVACQNKTGFVKLGALSANPPADTPPTPTPPAPNPPPAAEAMLKPGDSGEEVKALQRRLKALEWFFGDIGGNYQKLTTQAVKDFQKAAGLSVTGIADAATRRALDAKDAPRNKLDSTAQPVEGQAVEMDWWTSGIQQLFPRGATAVVTDVETGLSWHVYRSGGTNHADVQPKTGKDSALMKKAYGGSWSWERRAIWVSVGGRKVAASMNGMPHGSGSIADNDFDGHHCIHFTNSRTHGTNSLDAQHQAAIKRAAAAR